MSSRSHDGQRLTWLRAAPLGIALVGLGIFLGRSSEHPAHAGSAPTVVHGDGSAEGERLAALEREVRKLRVAAARRSDTSGRTAPGDREAGEPQPRTDEAEPAPGSERNLDPGFDEDDVRTEQHHLQFLDGLSDRLATEPYDDGWRQDNERALSEKLPTSFGEGVAVSEVSCASSVCRAKLTHTGSGRLPNAKVSEFLMNRGPLGSMEVHFDTRQDGVTKMYFLRQRPQQE